MLVGISPCPNDTFCFASFVEQTNSRVPMNVVVQSLEELNIQAVRNQYFDLTKISAAAFPYVSHEYTILSVGNAFATHHGPKCVIRKGVDFSQLSHLTLGIPGAYTSAYLTFRLLYGEPARVLEVPFREMIHALESGACDVGLLIHENSISALPGDLCLYADLGKVFRQRYHMPLPLGLVVARSSLGEEMLSLLNKMLFVSLQSAQRSSTLSSYVLSHAYDRREEVVRSHIASYVTEETKWLSEEGVCALSRWFQEAHRAGLLPQSSLQICRTVAENPISF